MISSADRVRTIHDNKRIGIPDNLVREAKSLHQSQCVSLTSLPGMDLIIKGDIVLRDMALKIIGFIQIPEFLHQLHIMGCYNAVPLKLCQVFQHGL